MVNSPNLRGLVRAFQINHKRVHDVYLSNDEIAKKLKYSRPQFYRAMRGSSGIPKERHAAWAKLLGVSQTKFAAAVAATAREFAIEKLTG
jgi:hypothetical protein